MTGLLKQCVTSDMTKTIASSFCIRQLQTFQTMKVYHFLQIYKKLKAKQKSYLVTDDGIRNAFLWDKVQAPGIRILVTSWNSSAIENQRERDTDTNSNYIYKTKIWKCFFASNLNNGISILNFALNIEKGIKNCWKRYKRTWFLF